MRYLILNERISDLKFTGNNDDELLWRMINRRNNWKFCNAQKVQNCTYLVIFYKIFALKISHYAQKNIYIGKLWPVCNNYFVERLWTVASKEVFWKIILRITISYCTVASTLWQIFFEYLIFCYLFWNSSRIWELRKILIILYEVKVW